MVGDITFATASAEVGDLTSLARQVSAQITYSTSVAGLPSIVGRSIPNPPNLRSYDLSKDIPQFSVAFAKSAVTTISSPQGFAPSNRAVFLYNVVEPLTNIGASGGYGNAAYQGFHSTVEWWSNAPVIAISMLGFQTTFQLQVDGQRIQQTRFATDASGQPYLFELTWNSGALTRHYKINAVNMCFLGVKVAATDQVWLPTYPTDPYLFFMGDSYTFGNGTSGDIFMNYCNPIATCLGMNWIQDGAGATGWNSTGIDTPILRITNDLLKRTKLPSIVITALGYNDQGGNLTTGMANYVSAMTALRKGIPGVKIITLGPWTPQGGPNNQTNLAAVASALQTNAGNLGIPFVPINDIYTSANFSKDDSGDNVHPNDYGHQFLGGRIAEKLLSVIG